MQRPHAGNVRLELAEPVRSDQLRSRHAVLDRPAESLEARHLGSVGRDDDLAAAKNGDAPLVAGEESRGASTQSRAFSDPGV